MHLLLLSIGESKDSDITQGCQTKASLCPSSSPLTFVVDAPERLCEVLDCCKYQAYSLFKQSGSTSNWNDVTTVYARRDTVRLRIRKRKTEICLNRRNGAEQRRRVSDDQEELMRLFSSGTCIDAIFLVDTYDYKGQAGIGLVAEKLLASLASYFELGEQPHRSLEDARMALHVFKNCGAVLFLESEFPDVVENDVWFSPDDISIPSINVSLAPFYWGNPKIQILHKDVRLKLHCAHMNVRYGPRSSSPLTIVVDAPESLCEVLTCCDAQAYSLFEQSGSTSNWNDVITVYAKRNTVRLRIRKRKTEICLNRRKGA
ncbi:hypothetical protein Cgig2_006114 [Carnegiea gigantea]|uniref:Uncharacterized protein n=1 Tax=Carnegiea gigantea TaxID=171969 RepID=A0A9Q1QSA9_9CARY|nr:hypothetical protein Cgig2_006114 [Carnegiea gigantea]